nr:MAG TPA: hypothetical protein [Caudoviricetes sp.]
MSAVSFPLPWERKKKHRLNKYKYFFTKKRYRLFKDISLSI